MSSDDDDDDDDGGDINVDINVDDDKKCDGPMVPHHQHFDSRENHPSQQQ